ncbi:1,2-diacylglycerol 3-alpha-glucosyltransferase [Carnobacterium iners]|uniref:1,2-diacylglycerol 3-alpha-glucosyltransferase n=1 Tax=Carnobacterium iners TaxID=1073423 RepID=A0A1X7MUD6_9LACT|nr:glycosyltransferase family 4 protein [Carnobacterium iners]SEL02999.1 1,2-diacylglycerol 3-alpha-glucosyltransferase [Carnobacterium iners]SMH28456.1 1,2-diacylglycerol 3-alpha-glucosyltransferase [Carnobacterium iners]
MRVGIFTDTYFPQISGVASSIETLKRELERQGHTVVIFTTTDPKVKDNEKGIIRLPSLPFFSFKDRRIAIKGMHRAVKVAKEQCLDIIHTQTEFSLGLTGKYIAYQLKIPCVHTYHTMYEDYLHYIGKGKILRPNHVKIVSKLFCNKSAGIIAPSEKAKLQLLNYGITSKIVVIPTGIVLNNFFKRTARNIRVELAIKNETPLLLSLGRVAKEKSIDVLINSMTDIISKEPETKLLIAGDGPERVELENLVKFLNLTKSIFFVGEVERSQVQAYYQAADLFVSASDSESQGLTYIESIASGTNIVARHNDYTEMLICKGEFGATFIKDEQLASIIYNCLIRKKQDLDTQNTIRNQKELLDLLSSELFGERVLQFYEEIIKQYNNEKLVVSD